MKFVFLTLCISLVFSSISVFAAENLIPEEVAAWVGSQKVLAPIADEMRNDGIDTFFKPRPDMMGSKFMPLYVTNINILKLEHPHYYNEVNKAVIEYRRKYYKEHYFSSAEEWARIGDRVMMAHFSLKSESSRTGYDDMFKIFTPDMIAKMPKSGQDKIKNMLDMMKSIQNVSEYDRQVVKKFDDEIVAFYLEMKK